MVAKIYKIAFLLMIWVFTAALTDNKSGVEPQVLSLPEGPGTITGLGDSYEPQLSSGSFTYVVPIQVSPGVKGFQPQLSFSYDTGFGSGALGLGWQMDIPFIQRRTSKGIPRYQDSDGFTYNSGQELVQISSHEYRFKIEEKFLKFIRADDAWETWSKSGVHNYYGENESSRITTVDGIFRWLISTSIDLNGNRIVYEYVEFDGNKYIGQIRYGTKNKLDRAIIFNYEDRDDVIIDYKIGHQIKTSKRLASVVVKIDDRLVRKYTLAYTPAPDTGVSLLSKITQLGSDDTTALPSLTFAYTTSSIADAAYAGSGARVLRGRMVRRIVRAPNISLDNPDVDLVDMNGDGLPDIVHTETGNHEYFLNDGQGGWEETPKRPAASPDFKLSDHGVSMADMDGDGYSDLMVQSVYNFGFFKGQKKPWEKESDWRNYYTGLPINLEDRMVRLVDLNNDGLTDVLYAAPNQVTAYLNDEKNPWSEAIDNHSISLDFSDQHVKLADMNGDHLQDLVYLSSSGSIFYYPGSGYGKFGEEVVMEDCPFLPDWKILDNSILLIDTNKDGTADLVRSDDGYIQFWINQNGKKFTEAFQINGAPDYPEEANTGDSIAPTLRQADVDGDTGRDLLYSFADHYVYVKFFDGSPPNLLNQIDNGLGKITKIEYKPSTSYNTNLQGSDWDLPFPIQVVEKMTIIDQNSGQEYRIVYQYDRGYFHGIEREFRGFVNVDQVEYGDESQPTLISSHVFDVGEAEESRKGLMLEKTVQSQGGEDVSGTVYNKIINSIATSTLEQGLDGQDINYSYISRTDTYLYEGTSNPKVMRNDFDYDKYGNEIKNFHYGQVSGDDLAAGNDEVLTATTYYEWNDDDLYLVDRPQQKRLTGLSGSFISDTRYTYDNKGNLILEERAVSDGSWVSFVSNEYDQYGNIVRITNANNNSSSIVYDSQYHTFPASETIEGLGLTMTAVYDPGFGKMTAVTDFNGHLTRFGYDVFGRLIYIVKPGDSVLLPTEEYSYILGNPVSTLVSRKREVSGQWGTYDTFAFFDGLGRKLQVRSEGENNQWVVSEAVEFNLRQQPKNKWLSYFANAPSYSQAPANQAHKSIVYDPTGRSNTETNPDGTTRTYAYLPLEKKAWNENGVLKSFFSDGRERIVEVRENNKGETYVTSYEYDGLDNLTKITDTKGNVKIMTYDGLGRKTYMDDPDRGEMTYAYDGVGNLIKTVDNKNQALEYTYDQGNRVLNESHDGQQHLTYHYDIDRPLDRPYLDNTMGRLAWVEDDAGQLCYSYDSRGNIVSKHRKVGSQEFPLNFNYDSMGRLTKVVYPDGMEADYKYNAMNQIESISDFVDNIDYNADGQKLKFVYTNGLDSTYAYDSRQRLTSIKTLNGTFSLQDLYYGYDSVGNIVSINDGRTDQTPEDLSRTYTYDDLNQLTQCQAKDWKISYTYNSIGNMIAKTSDVVDSKVNLGDLLYGQGDAGPHAVTKAGNYTYTYDANGNLNTKTGFIFLFNKKDRLSFMERTSDGLAAEYLYDAEGSRVMKKVTQGEVSSTTIYIDKFSEVRSGQIRNFVFAGDRRVAVASKDYQESSYPSLNFNDFDADHDGRITLAEIKAKGEDPNKVEAGELREAIKLYKGYLGNNSNAITFEVMAAAFGEYDGPLNTPIEKIFIIPDHLGSSAIVVDNNGNVIEESVYYPYGMNRRSKGDYEAEYRYGGKELDQESDLYYFGARYYDPLASLFISPDSIIQDAYSPMTLNIYNYCLNNPLKFTDPNGHWAIWDHGIMTFAAAISEGYGIKESLDLAMYSMKPDWDENVGHSEPNPIQHATSEEDNKQEETKKQTEAFIAENSSKDDLESTGKAIHATEDLNAEWHAGNRKPQTDMEKFAHHYKEIAIFQLKVKDYKTFINYVKSGKKSFDETRKLLREQNEKHSSE